MSALAQKPQNSKSPTESHVNCFVLAQFALLITE